MTKLGQGGKKKARKAAYMKRQIDKLQIMAHKNRYKEVMKNGTMEEMAELMDIRLK